MPSPMPPLPSWRPTAPPSPNANIGGFVRSPIASILLGLDAAPPAIREMERQLTLNEDVLRFMTVRVEEITEEPSAILSRKSDDRERGFRGPKPAGRFETGRKRGFDEREEFRARDEFRADRDEYIPEEDV
jgi:small subunit ribosomal protein S6